MKIYHNPRCSKSREALKIIESKNIKFEVIEYLKKPINKLELHRILKLLNISAFELIRKNESIYKEKYKEADFSNDQWVDVICSNPVLMERPIILKDNQAIIGRPPEKVLNLL
tara:strand:+ start:673 stop:1011 length:339 start_codon:yes stop_codon:yes gene_type:complete